MTDMKMTGQTARHEIAGRENSGHEIARQKNTKCSFRCYFLITQHYDAMLNLVKLLTQSAASSHAACELINVQCAGVTTVIQFYQPRD